MLQPIRYIQIKVVGFRAGKITVTLGHKRTVHSHALSNTAAIQNWLRDQRLIGFLTEHFTERLPYENRVRGHCHIELLQIQSGPDPYPVIEIRVHPYGKSE